MASSAAAITLSVGVKTASTWSAIMELAAAMTSSLVLAGGLHIGDALAVQIGLGVGDGGLAELVSDLE